MNATLVAVFCLLSVISVHAFNAYRDGSTCPPEEEIRPCTCNNETRDIRCSSIAFTTDLKNVFKKLAGGSYEDLMIVSSALQYIPHEIEDVQFRRLFVITSTFIDLFDESPTNLTSLEAIHIEKSTFLRMNWDRLTPLTSLNELRISSTVSNIQVLDEKFGASLPKSLKTISLQRTGTSTIKAGAFNGLDNLETLEVKTTALNSLSRDMFPIPFNVEHLSFIENALLTLPKDLFTQMPKLKTIDLRVNGLSEVPEEAFGETAPQLDALLLDVNPLKCDCTIEWIVKNGPKVRSGTCASPEEMKNKTLSELTTDDFNC